MPATVSTGVFHSGSGSPDRTTTRRRSDSPSDRIPRDASLQPRPGQPSGTPYLCRELVDLGETLLEHVGDHMVDVSPSRRGDGHVNARPGSRRGAKTIDNQNSEWSPRLVHDDEA